MKLIQTAILLFLFFNSNGQSEKENKKSLFIFAGGKTRVTPIYLKQLPYVIHFNYYSDTWEQPDKHLSGPGLQIGERKKIGDKYDVTLNQVIRYDYIYQVFPLVEPPPIGFKYTIKQKIIFDLYADFVRILPAKKSIWRASLGVAVCGLNTGYTETQRIYQTSTNYTDYYKKKDFIFPAIRVGMGWQKNNILAELNFGYCWNNPTLWKTPFLFPELILQYQLFELKKK